MAVTATVSRAQVSRARGGTLKRQTVTEAAAEAIRERILAGDYAEGESLRQDALAAELGVSRIPIREAFRQLEAEGLVTLHAHRGAVVSALSLDEIAELFDLRALLEPDLLARAIPNMTEGDLAAAERILQSYENALNDADVHAWGEMNSEFHLTLYRPAGRSRSLGMVQSLLGNTDRYTRLQLVLTSGVERARAEHAQLLKLCRQRNAQEAGDLVRRHVHSAGEDLLAFLRQHRPG
ncbi:GntR family transcriptional regulator [Aliidongia dinghuensis]|uniref:GntR family transcriptional regulator n=1 Tax=Aliidongia dinghuensis TaxID=1867774 RepID=A0A8J3E4F6_9PROT|nr:GntR family transcriptional regulator [Aliidongia dinghuensis]GGF14098.1 GntR family transcriptional regulator [Aliidongia dinghuensis]